MTMQGLPCLIRVRSSARDLDWSVWRSLLPQVGGDALSLALLIGSRVEERSEGHWVWRVTESELAAAMSVSRDSIRAYLFRLTQASLVLRPQRGMLQAGPGLIGGAAASGAWDLAEGNSVLAEVVPLRAVAGDGPYTPVSADFSSLGGDVTQGMRISPAVRVGKSDNSGLMHDYRYSSTHECMPPSASTASTASSTAAVRLALAQVGFNNERLVPRVLDEPERALACLQAAQRKCGPTGNAAGLFYKMFFTDKDFQAPTPPLPAQSADPAGDRDGTGQEASRARVALALADLADVDPGAHQSLLDRMAAAGNPVMEAELALRELGYLQ